MLWLFWFLGQLMHLFFRARKTIVSGLPNGIGTWKQYLIVRGSSATVRIFFSSMLFGLWTLEPSIVDDTAKALAENLQPGMIRSVIEKISLNLNIFTAGAFGYLAESLLEKVPWLNKELPKNGNGG